MFSLNLYVMKRVTTIICCMCLMLAGAFLALHEFDINKHIQIQAGQPAPLVWNIPKGNVIPLDLQLDLEKRQTSDFVKDSINIVDSIRWVDKYVYKVKYKTVSDRTTARNVGEHIEAVTPDSLPVCPTEICAPEREEQPGEIVGVPKTPSVQLTIDGNVVYSTDDIHSTGEGQ